MEVCALQEIFELLDTCLYFVSRGSGLGDLTEFEGPDVFIEFLPEAQTQQSFGYRFQLRVPRKWQFSFQRKEDVSETAHERLNLIFVEIVSLSFEGAGSSRDVLLIL